MWVSMMQRVIEVFMKPKMNIASTKWRAISPRYNQGQTKAEIREKHTPWYKMGKRAKIN